jgi:tRNA 2-selenouridine synthase SelU
VSAAAEDDGASPILWRRLGRDWNPVGYDEEAMMEEAAFIAYHLHWPLDDILSMEHLERQRWTRMISEMNQQANEQLGSLVT